MLPLHGVIKLPLLIAHELHDTLGARLRLFTPRNVIGERRLQQPRVRDEEADTRRSRLLRCHPFILADLQVRRQPVHPTLLAPYGGTRAIRRGDNTLVMLPSLKLMTLGARDRCNSGVKACVTTATDVICTFRYSLYVARIAERFVS
jgi:hypothetical protein